MEYNVLTIPSFDRQAKQLSKKHTSFIDDLALLIASLSKNPIQGNSLGKNCYKIRLAIKSKGKGKSAGARIITHIHISKDDVYLLAVYDKSSQSSITDSQIKKLLDEIED